MDLAGLLNKVITMKYTYLPVEGTTLMELRTDKFIFMLDSTEPVYDKMLTDFQDPINIERFIALLDEDSSTAFQIYNETV
jgi:hypothetical protein